MDVGNTGYEDRIHFDHKMESSGDRFSKWWRTFVLHDAVENGCRWMHSCTVFGIYRVQISSWRPTLVIEVLLRPSLQISEE
jgi:hypothetical protein